VNAVKSCCLAEARKSLKRPRDVATCDECGSLLLAYGSARDFESTIEELTRHGVAFESADSEVSGVAGGLAIVAKSRKRP
jgi:hypothetical protein